jgi:hypothetical protein
MFRVSHSLAATLALAGATLLAACRSDDGATVEGPSSGRGTPGTHLQYGTPVKVGDGMARTYVVLDQKDDGAPVELGVALDERALDGLPTEMESHGGMSGIDLALPAQNPTPYRFVELDWNPQGHPPLAIYGVPHFDVHFYTITPAERNAIDPADPQFAAKALASVTIGTGGVPAGQVPAGYVPPPGPVTDNAVPMMGVHWIDPASPEFAGQPFTRTFLYGNWNGRFIFAEPMVTRAFLLTKPDVTVPVGTATHYVPAGQYPSAYRVSYDAQAREYHVALTGFASRG